MGLLTQTVRSRKKYGSSLLTRLKNMFDINKFTHKSQEAIQRSVQLAQEFHHQAIEPEHLALSLLEDQNGLVPGLLKSLGLDVEDFGSPLRRYLQDKPSVETSSGQAPHLSSRLDAVLNQAQDLAKSMKDEYVALEHLFISLAREKKGVVAEVLSKRGIHDRDLLKTLETIRKGQRVKRLNCFDFVR